jgi:hypothetical protein
VKLYALAERLVLSELEISPDWRPVPVTYRSDRGANHAGCSKKGKAMSSTAIIQVVAGVLFVVVLIVLIQRRRTKVK